MMNRFSQIIDKSDIKLIEACVLGIPCLCQDMDTYNSAPETLRFSSVGEFEQKIASILNWKNKANYYNNIQGLRAIGQKRILELDPNIGCHIEALSTPFGSADREYLKKWN